MLGDSLLVFDFLAMRTTVFAPGGELVRTNPVNRQALMELAASSDLRYGGVRYLDDGSFLLRSNEPRNTLMPEGVFRPTEGLALVPSDFSMLHLLGWFPTAERINVGSRERPLPASVALTPVTMRSDGGKPVRVYVGDQAAYSLSRYTPDGTVDLIVRKRGPARPVTPADLAIWEEQWRGIMGPHYAPADLERLINDVPHRSTLPFFDSVAVGERGDLWVQAFEADRDAPVRYVVFGVDGVQQGVVHLPPRFSPLEIGEDYILGTLRDEEDVQIVHLYELRRGV